MAKPFLIVGLPRSRTAWLAVVANTIPDVICYHEPFLETPTWQDSLRVWLSADYEHVGVSDAGLGFHLAEIIEKYHPRVLVIDRPAHEVETSGNAIGLETVPGFCRLLLARIAPLRCHPLVKVVAFHGLSSSSVVRSCLWHLMPGARIDTDKIALLQHLNVQTDMRRMRRIIEARRDELPEMMGLDVIEALRAAVVEACA
jgi:hypothetical protein